MGFTSFTLFRPDAGVCYSFCESFKGSSGRRVSYTAECSSDIATRCFFNASGQRRVLSSQSSGQLEAFTFNTIG